MLPIAHWAPTMNEWEGSLTSGSTSAGCTKVPSTTVPAEMAASCFRLGASSQWPRTRGGSGQSPSVFSGSSMRPQSCRNLI